MMGVLVTNFYAQRDITKIWKEVGNLEFATVPNGGVVPSSYRAFSVETNTFEGILRTAPLEFSSDALKRDVIISLPYPSGDFRRFRVYESPILSSELSAKFPDIKSYSGQGIDDETATTRISFSSKGFSAFVVSGNGSYMINPYTTEGREYHLAYFVRDTDKGTFECLTKDVPGLSFDQPKSNPDVALTGQNLRHYRLVVSATSQFYQFSGGTDAGLLQTINTLLNSVNAIYEREATIRFVLFFVLPDRNGTFFPPNQSLPQMKELNQTLTDSNVGNANYDSGHVFGYINGSGGGESTFSALCNNALKAKVASVVNSDLYQSTILVAHELGHKFNARHSFSSFSGLCLAQNDPSGRFEPGSGSTIMSYAGSCAPENLQPTSDSFFHNRSILSIINHVDTVYPTCGQRTATGNSPPVIVGLNGANVFIPASTPFYLTGLVSDPNSDPLTFSWEQIDSGQGISLFRSYVPGTFATRVFPSFPFILNNQNNPPIFMNGFLVGELLPNSTRTLNFALTARDNRSSGGGTSSSALQVNVRGEAGPFAVTNPNTNITWNGGTQQVVTWSVANTTAAPISTANVRISLSTDGGQTFLVILAESTPNDGSQPVVVPNIQTTNARILVEALNNIYFDVSNTNFAITAPAGSEGDVAPRPNGDGQMVSGDVVQARRFVAGLDTINAATNEFQRADSAPRSTFGDGALSSADVVQARRYAAALDPPTNAGGPTVAADPGLRAVIGGSLFRATVEGQGLLRLASGKGGAVFVELVSSSEVAAVSFRLNYDAALGKPLVSLGDVPDGAVLTVNDSVEGEITILIDSAGPLGDSGKILRLVKISFANESANGAVELDGEASVSDLFGNEVRVHSNPAR